jgi:hypothetical protein
MVLSFTGQPRTAFLHDHQSHILCSMFVLCNLDAEFTDIVASPLAITDLFLRGSRKKHFHHVVYFTWSTFFFFFFLTGKRALNSYDTYHYSTSPFSPSPFAKLPFFLFHSGSVLNNLFFRPASSPFVYSLITYYYHQILSSLAAFPSLSSHRYLGLLFILFLPFFLSTLSCQMGKPLNMHGAIEAWIDPPFFPPSLSILLIDSPFIVLSASFLPILPSLSRYFQDGSSSLAG